MKAMRLFVIVGTISLLFALSGCGFIDDLKARDQLNKGVKAFKDKAYEEAADHFKKAIELDPEMKVAYQYLATSYSSQFVPGLYSERNTKIAHVAIEAFKKVLEMDPGNVNAMKSIASLYNALGDYDKAKIWNRKILENNPSDEATLYSIGVIDWNIVHNSVGNNGEYAANLKPEQKEKLNITVDEAIDVLKKALEINPNYADAMSYLNLCYRQKAYLSEDQETKDEYIRQADRLAAKAMIMKKKLEREKAKAKSKIF